MIDIDKPIHGKTLTKVSGFLDMNIIEVFVETQFPDLDDFEKYLLMRMFFHENIDMHYNVLSLVITDYYIDDMNKKNLIYIKQKDPYTYKQKIFFSINRMIGSGVLIESSNNFVTFTKDTYDKYVAVQTLVNL